MFLRVKVLVVCAVVLASLVCIGGCKEKGRGRTVVCFGDSLTTCGGKGGRYPDWLAKWLADDVIINKGVDADSLAGGRARFERDVLELKPDVVIIELGTNDFFQMERDISQLRADLGDMVFRARQAGIEVVVTSIFGERDYLLEEKVEFGPARYALADRIWRMEEQLCKEYGCFYVPNMQVDIKPNGKKPYWGDNYHPSGKGNEFVAKRILVELKKALKSSARK